jgi:uncharacterized membrane protein
MNVLTCQLAVVVVILFYFYRAVMTFPTSPTDRSRWILATLGLVVGSVFLAWLVGLPPFHPVG